MTDAELVERVAAEVMGWHKDGMWWADEDNWYKAYIDNEENRDAHEGWDNEMFWNPLTNDAHMDMVLAVLAERKWEMSISHFIGDGGMVISDVWLDGNFHQVLTPRGDIAVQRQENCMTMLAMKRAILRAALGAVNEN